METKVISAITWDVRYPKVSVYGGPILTISTPWCSKKVGPILDSGEKCPGAQGVKLPEKADFLSPAGKMP